jgi:hypothetical protein
MSIYKLLTGFLVTLLDLQHQLFIGRFAQYPPHPGTNLIQVLKTESIILVQIPGSVDLKWGCQQIQTAQMTRMMLS